MYLQSTINNTHKVIYIGVQVEAIKLRDYNKFGNIVINLLNE